MMVNGIALKVLMSQAVQLCRVSLGAVLFFLFVPFMSM
jgi:hypothetical protein